MHVGSDELGMRIYTQKIYNLDFDVDNHKQFFCDLNTYNFFLERVKRKASSCVPTEGPKWFQ